MIRAMPYYYTVKLQLHQLRVVQSTYVRTVAGEAIQSMRNQQWLPWGGLQEAQC